METPSHQAVSRNWTPAACLADGWQNNVALSVTGSGVIERIEVGVQPGDCHRLSGPVIPAMTNAHSHAFQRAMAGLTEYRASKEDDFWSWRDLMYRFVQQLTPDDIYSIATMLYAELLEGGFSQVVEFHYLHRPCGVPAMQTAEALIAAAQEVGLGITLAPVLYQRQGFANNAPEHAQQPFILTNAQYIDLLESLSTRLETSATSSLAMAIHSLRAVGPTAMADVLQSAGSSHPIHIHIAEQKAEVGECLKVHGCRPVEWLLQHAAVNQRWNLVHATHVTDSELRDIAQAGACVVLCPSTEANLGDGLFPVADFARQGGRIAIGTDSHVERHAAQELKLAEYGQRLQQQKRCIGVSGQKHIGQDWWQHCARNGAQSAGLHAGRLAPGERADWVVLDADQEICTARSHAETLDSFIFSGIHHDAIADVYVGGKSSLNRGVHPHKTSITKRYQTTLKSLLQRI